MSETGKEESKVSKPTLRYFVNCATDGRQQVPQTEVEDWGDEWAELMGERTVTANCPKCHSTLSVTTKPSSP